MIKLKLSLLILYINISQYQTMLRLCLASLALLCVLAEGGIFDLDPESLEESQMCQEINETFYKYVNIILNRFNGLYEIFIRQLIL